MYYGWWIVVASMGALALAGAVYWQGFGLFFLPLAREFSTGRAALASAYSVSQVEGGLLGPVGGYLSDRFGPRRMMVIGVGVTGVGYLLLSRVDTFLGFYLVFVLVVSLGVSVGIRVPTLVVTNNWFVQKRGIALGLMSSGTGLGGVFVPWLGWLIARLGWRNAAAIVGVVVWCVGLPIAAVLRRRPEEYGLRPDGRTEPAAERQAAPQQSSYVRARAEATYNLGQALRTRVFWSLALAFGLRQFAVGAVGVHMVPYLIGAGTAPEVAATILGLAATTSVVGRLGFGWLADRVEKRYVAAVTMGLVGLGSLVLAYVSAWWHIVFFVLFYAVGWGGGVPLMYAIRGEYFGRRAYGSISGSMDGVQMFGLVGGPVISGFIFDRTGSYFPAFAACAASALLASGVMLVLGAQKTHGGPDERSSLGA